MVLFPPSPSEKSFGQSLVVLIEARSVFKPESSPRTLKTQSSFNIFHRKFARLSFSITVSLVEIVSVRFADGALMKMDACQYILCAA